MIVPSPDVIDPSSEATLQAPLQPKVGGVFTVVYAAWTTSLVTNQAYSILAFIVLSAQSVGLLNWGTAAAALAFVVLDGGVDTASVIVAKQTTHSLRELTLAVGGVRLLAAGIAISCWALASLVGLLHGHERTVLLLAGVGFALRSLETPFTTSLLVADRQATVALLGLAHSLMRMASLGVVLIANQATPEAILTAAISADFLLIVCAGIIAQRVVRTSSHRGDVLTGSVAAGILRAAPWVNATQILMALQSRLDWLLVAGLVSYQGLANYALANKGLEFIVLGGSVFGKIALPWFVEGWTSRKIGSSLAAVLTIAIAASLALALAGSRVLGLLFGSKYGGAGTVIPVMAGLAPALMLLPILQYSMQARGRSFAATLAAAAGLFGQVVVDVVLIPRIGILGAAAGMCAFGTIAVPLQLVLATRMGTLPRDMAIRLGLAAAVAPAAVAMGAFLGIHI